MLATRAAFVGAAALACGDSTAPLTAPDLVGAYALATLGGQPLPAPYGDGVSLVVADVLTLSADGTYTDVYRDSTTGYPGVGTQTYQGTWTLDSAHAQVALSYSIGHGITATPPYAIRDRGRTLVFTTPKGDWVYGRR